MALGAVFFFLLATVLSPVFTLTGQNADRVRTATKSNSPATTSRNGESGMMLCGEEGCPLGYFCTNGTCQCRKAPGGIVWCSDNDLHKFAVIACYCVSFDRNKSLVDVGACIENCQTPPNAHGITVFYHHYRNKSYDTCQLLNRTGTLCGKCLPDHYPLVYSYSLACVKCHHIRWNWVKYIMAAYLPLTVFCLCILLFKVNISSSRFHSAFLYSQAMAMPPFVRILLLDLSNESTSALTTLKTAFSLYGIWNLDFFRSFYSDLCLGIGILPTLALDYAIAAYPLLLVIISYVFIKVYDRKHRVITVMCTPFCALFKRNFNIRASLIDSFSSFFLLSNVKFLSVTFDLLVPTQIYHLYGDTYNYTLGLYYSADIEYFGREHLPYGILAIVVLCVFVILPVAVLALYPFAFFQKFLNLFPVRWYILHTFVDSFQGCYKDGTEPGTHDYRWFSAVYLILRFTAFLLYGIMLDVQYFSLCCLLLLFTLLLLVIFQPYKNRFFSHFKLNTVFFILLAMFYAVTVAIGRASIASNQTYTKFLRFLFGALVIVPLLYIPGFLLYWVFSNCLGPVRRLRWWCRGYAAVDADAYCDRVVNPQAYPTIPASQMINCSVNP